jgi:hypothetical protein
MASLAVLPTGTTNHTFFVTLLKCFLEPGISILDFAAKLVIEQITVELLSLRQSWILRWPVFGGYR